MLLAIFLSFLSTMLGGLVSMRFRDKFHVILGFTSGVLLAVVAFDILPEIMELVRETKVDPRSPMIALVAGFFLFHVIEKCVAIDQARQAGATGEIRSPVVGRLSALALAGHSFMDGVGIGLGFQVSASTGALVALAVIAHDFSDGLNTASLMLVHNNSPRRTLLFVLLDAVAPLLGGLSTLFFQLPHDWLVLYLGFFAGFLLCIGASDILPEAYEHKLSHKPMFMAILGAALIYFVVTRMS